MIWNETDEEMEQTFDYETTVSNGRPHCPICGTLTESGEYEWHCHEDSCWVEYVRRNGVTRLVKPEEFAEQSTVD